MAAHLSIIAALALQALAANTGHEEVKIGAPIPLMLLTKPAIQVRQEVASTSFTGYKSVAVQIPVATVCPAGNGTQTRNVFTPVILVDKSQSPVTTSATAPLPNGSSTTYAMLASRADVREQNLTATRGQYSDMAQLVLGTDGCQTLYTPTTTAKCSTLITPAGLPPVSITNCAQYVTFSSEVIHQCSATPTITPLPADPETSSTVMLDSAATTPTPSIQREKRQIALDRNGKPMMTDLQTIAPTQRESRQAAVGRNGKPTITDLETVAPSPTGLSLRSPNVLARLFSVPVLNARSKRSHIVLARQVVQNSTMPDRGVMNATLMDGGNIKVGNAAQKAELSPPAPTKYYAALWQEVLGGVPSHVKGITCYGGLPPIGDCTSPDTDGDTESCGCSTADESWSVTVYKQVRIGTTVVSFNGPVVITSGTLTATTTISFENTLTTTQTQNYASIIRSTVSEPVVRITQTTIPQATLSLISVTSLEGAVFAAMPQSQAASITSTPSADVVSDDFTSSITTVPEAPGTVSATIANADGVSVPASMATDMSLSVSMPTGEQNTVAPVPADVPITTRVTSIIVETVTVNPTEDVVKREDWPTNIWAANLPTYRPQVKVEDQDIERREDWPTDVWAANLPTDRPQILPAPVVGGENAVLPAMDNDIPAYTVS